jgi:hypothetical protein
MVLETPSRWVVRKTLATIRLRYRRGENHSRTEVSRWFIGLLRGEVIRKKKLLRYNSIPPRREPLSEQRSLLQWILAFLRGQSYITKGSRLDR